MELLLYLLGLFIVGLVIRYLIEPRHDWVGFVVAVLCAAAIVALLARGRQAPVA
jgi:CDP-diglyceride synthetase